MFFTQSEMPYRSSAGRARNCGRVEIRIQIGLQRYADVKIFRCNKAMRPDSIQALLRKLEQFDRVIVSVHNTTWRLNKDFGVPGSSMEIIREIAAKKPTIFALFANPYTLTRAYGANYMASVCAAEGEQILKAIPAGERVVALDVQGKRVSTEELARQLAAWQMSGDNYNLLIGGPDGLSPACLARADLCWSLSDLTLPHPLVRVLLAEQLYRAWTITVNHPYHRA